MDETITIEFTQDELNLFIGALTLPKHKYVPASSAETLADLKERLFRASAEYQSLKKWHGLVDLGIFQPEDLGDFSGAIESAPTQVQQVVECLMEKFAQPVLPAHSIPCNADDGCGIAENAYNDNHQLVQDELC